MAPSGLYARLCHAFLVCCALSSVIVMPVIGFSCIFSQPHVIVSTVLLMSLKTDLVIQALQDMYILPVIQSTA